MPHPSKAKGDRCEVAVVHYLSEHFPNCRRGKAGGEADLGDIFGVVDRDGDGWTLQVADRNWRAFGEIEAKAVETAAQSERAATPFWALVVKRAGTADVGRWFVWLPMWVFIDRRDQRAGFTPVPSEDWLDITDAGVKHELACISVRAWLALVAPSAATDATAPTGGK